MQAVYTRLGIVLTYTVMRMRNDVDAKRRRAREVDVCAVESDKVGASTPNGDVHARSTSVQWRVTKSERRRHWHVDVTTQMSTYSSRTSTLEREVDVCARTNFVTNGLPYGRGGSHERKSHRTSNQRQQQVQNSQCLFSHSAAAAVTLTTHT